MEQGILSEPMRVALDGTLAVPDAPGLGIELALPYPISREEDEMALTVGQPAPDFTLKSHDERSIRLSDYRGKKHVVLAFFPLAWTPV
jgi:hypothetical protein